MNAIADRLLALFALGSIVALPLLVVAWFLFPKKKRREPEPDLEAAAAVAASFIVQGR